MALIPHPILNALDLNILQLKLIETRKGRRIHIIFSNNNARKLFANERINERILLDKIISSDLNIFTSNLLKCVNTTFYERSFNREFILRFPYFTDPPFGFINNSLVIAIMNNYSLKIEIIHTSCII